MSAVIIEPIAESHIPGFFAALDEVARERRYLAQFEAPAYERVETFVRNNIDCGHPQVVALADARVVGWCDVIPMQTAVHAHAGVLGIGIVAAHRGAGVGRRLMNAAIDGARRFGLKRVELAVRARNHNAIALYEKLGFAHEGIKRRAILVDGEYDDSLVMALLLDE